MGVNLSQIINKVLPVQLSNSKELDTTHHSNATVSGNGAIADVTGYGSITFQVGGTFKAEVIFEGNIIAGIWERFPVIKADGSYVKSATTSGIYRADVSGYKQVRARLIWTSGTLITVRSLALPIASTKDITVSQSRQNNTIFSLTDSYQLNRNFVYYGNFTRGSTSLVDIMPIDFTNFSKKALYVVNNFNVSMKIVEYHMYFDIAPSGGTNYIKTVPIEIIIAPGTVGKLSGLEYPELNDPFAGLAVSIQAHDANAPTTGSIKLIWLGGNN